MKPNIHFYFIVTFMVLFQSCVPYKDIVYVQGDLPQENIDQSLYKIRKNDILYISIRSSNETIERFFKMQDNISNVNQNATKSLYFTGYTVDKDGYIEMPIIDKIYVENNTFKGVKELIKQRLLESQFRSLDDVFIKVKLAGIPYTIIGEVKKPQTGVLYKEKPNIFDVLSDASDITMVGDRKTVVVIRTENNKQIKSTLDLTDANIVQSPYYYIRPNDIIYVQPLRQKTLGTGTTLSQTISTTITALSLVTTIILLSRL